MVPFEFQSCGGSGKRSIYGRVRRTSDVMSEGGVDQVFTTHSVLQILEDTESCGNTVVGKIEMLYFSKHSCSIKRGIEH